MAETNIKDVKLKIGTENQFQSKLKDLPLSTLVGTTDPIQEGELDTSIITKLNKAENALPKPTNDTTGSAGQVLKKTANGSEWGDAPSGGGKLYLHKIRIYGSSTESTLFSVYSSKQAQYNLESLVADFLFADDLYVGGSCSFNDNNNSILVYPLIKVGYSTIDGAHIKSTYAGSNGNQGTRVYEANSPNFLLQDMVNEL